MGLAWEGHFTPYHRVWNRAQWATLPASQSLRGLLGGGMVPPGAPIVLGADETGERRSGRQIHAKGGYRDAVRSARKHVVKGFGLKWVSLLLLVPVPGTRRVGALPFLTVLCWPPQSRHQRRHKTRVDWVGQMVKQTRRWLPGRLLVLGVDGGFAAVALAWACGARQGTLVSRLRLAAALYHPPVPSPPGKRGRKPTKGTRQRSLKIWAARSDTPWQETRGDW
jgi:hypothetical protein